MPYVSKSLLRFLACLLALTGYMDSANTAYIQVIS